jgi:dehydrogenase/reductase SDR family protein 12
MISALDFVLDRTILFGYSRPGYELRRRGWPDAGRLPRLGGLTVAVTGATAGLGKATAKALYDLDARVLLLVRSEERGQQLVRELGGTFATPAGEDRLKVVICDLSDLASVRRCAATLLESGETVDVLINNAGVMAAERSLSADGIELTFATNMVGPFLLTNLVEPTLAAAGTGSPGASRIINISSGGMYGQRIHTDDLQMERDYNGVTAYARSKRAMVILTELWAERWREDGVGVHSMHPGWADTEGVRDSLPRFYTLTKPLLRTPAQGADTTVWLAGADAATLGTGGFWHDRRRRPTHLLPTTRESASDRESLWHQLCELSGWDDSSTAPAPEPAASEHR